MSRRETKRRRKPFKQEKVFEESCSESHQPLIHTDVNFIGISEVSSLAEKKIEYLNRSRALYNEGEQNVCVSEEKLR